jgi:DNA-binding NtrC family response regulator
MTEKRRPTILLVDDEEMMLTAMKTFLGSGNDYDLRAYTSPSRALRDLGVEIKMLDLVITDFMMPEMDGIAFLTRVKERFPLAPRILMTGYADKESAIKAINNVGLYQYVEKPWDEDDLRMIVRNGLEKTTLLRQLEEKVREVERVHRELHAVQNDILRVFV